MSNQDGGSLYDIIRFAGHSKIRTRWSPGKAIYIRCEGPKGLRHIFFGLHELKAVIEELAAVEELAAGQSAPLSQEAPEDHQPIPIPIPIPIRRGE